MTFGANSNVTLNSGVHTFASLVVEPDVQVIALGNVEIDVQGQLTVGDRADVIGSASQNLLIGHRRVDH